MRPLRGLFILEEEAYRLVYGPDELRDVARHMELMAPPQTRSAVAERRDLLADVEVILSGWGGPRLDEAFLQATPRLRAMFYAAGSLASILTDAVWKRPIKVTSALEANAVPVAEYALATILFSLKHGWQLSRQVREQRTYALCDRNAAPGVYKSTIGLISLGAVARKLLDLLKPFDLNIVVYDPFASRVEAKERGFSLVSLGELFRCSDVVSLHTPQLDETEGIITGEMLASMKHGAAFINTARAVVVRQDEMLRVAGARSDLHFVLDVAHPEPPEPRSLLYTLPNVVLTPHIAGSTGKECRRMGRYMVEELERFVTGRPLRWAVTPESVKFMSHRPVPATESRVKLTPPRVTVTVRTPSPQPFKV